MKTMRSARLKRSGIGGYEERFTKKRAYCVMGERPATANCSKRSAPPKRTYTPIAGCAKTASMKSAQISGARSRVLPPVVTIAAAYDAARASATAPRTNDARGALDGSRASAGCSSTTARSGSLCYAAVSHCAADLSWTDDPIPEKCGDQDQQRRESSTRDQGHGSDEHRRSLAAARRGRDQRLVDDLELDAADLEKSRRELRPLDSGLEIADAHDCVVQREAKLPLPMLVDVTQRSAVALVELIERLLSFEGPPLLELELALIEG